jgi:hypothetical protein
MRKEVKGMRCKRCDCDPYQGDDRIEEDWEATGQDEMNDLYDKIIQKTPKRTVLEVRDRLVNLKDLVTVCREALCESKLYEIKTIVIDVLYFHVEEQIKIAEQELANV